VAQAAYGQIVVFAANSCRQMVDDGTVVLVEGREQMLDYIPTHYRYCLIMDPIERLGFQRAAQLLAGDIIASLNKDMKDILKSHSQRSTSQKEGE